MNPDNQALARRLYNVIPAASFQMEKLLGLVDIVISDEVPTAAVECTRSPRLLLNPAFVEEFCQRDGHLLMLVMHELHHIILGHTSLFPRHTLAHNIAFDAIINAMLCRQFPSEADFFRSTNGWESFPGRLLRPAPGWPASPEPLPDDATRNERRVHQMLYGDDHQQVTYHEVFELLLEALTASDQQAGAVSNDPPADEADPAPGGNHDEASQQLAEAADFDVVLLGDHEAPSEAGELDERAVRNGVLTDVLRRIVEAWPPPDRSLSGRDQGRTPGDWAISTQATAQAELRRALRRLLAKAGVLAGATHGQRRFTREEFERPIRTVRPQLGDRQAHAWARIHGRRPLLWRGQVRATRNVQRPRPVAHVYLDISGSMHQALPALGAALAEPHRSGALRLFVFSTVIDEARPGKLSGQHFANTGGTDIACVIEHLRQIPAARRPRRVVLITDGYVGRVKAQDLAELNVSLFVGHYALYGDRSVNDLAPVARHIEVLPALPGAS